MIRSIFITAVLLITFTSCNKEKFPTSNDLTGSWIEQTNNSYKNKLVFTNNTMCFVQKTYTDTFSYRLDKEQKSIHLKQVSDPSGYESSQKISLSSDKRELTVLGLYISVDKESITVFKKE